MNVGELIKLLKVEDTNAMVVSSGYESGVTEVDGVAVIRVTLNANEEWFFGEHQPISPFADEDSGDASVLQIIGKRH